jgi:integrase
MESLEIDPLTEFYDSIKNVLTKDRYEKRLALFFRHLKLEGSLKEQAKAFTKKAKQDLPWTTFVINEWIRLQKERAERGEISESTIIGFYKPIRLFCEENDILLNFKKIARRIPRGKKYASDRAPSREEIMTILGYPDRRIKPAVFIMESSGCRVGAFEHLNYGHIEPIKRNGVLVAAKIKIYAGTNDEYESYVTPECYHAIEDYMQFRKTAGEKITKDSPLIRDLFHPDRLGKGEPHLPKRLMPLGVKRMIEDALKGTGLRTKLEKGKKRHEFQADHGFRKFFKTACERKMKSLHVEMLLGHTTGLADSYYRPDGDELLNEYLKAVPDLTLLEAQALPISEDVEELKRQLSEEREARLDLQIKQEAMFRYLSKPTDKPLAYFIEEVKAASELQS